MKWLEAHLFGPVAAARIYLLPRAFCLLLAFDAWLEFTRHGGRYGHGGFNVAHFGWLDELQPLPTPALYLAVLALVGFGSFVVAVGPAGVVGRAALVAVATFFTWGWAMSMVDSYQHHYLISIVLLHLALLPRPSAIAVFGMAPRRSEPAPGHLVGPAVIAVSWGLVGVVAWWQGGASWVSIALLLFAVVGAAARLWLRTPADPVRMRWSVVTAGLTGGALVLLGRLGIAPIGTLIAGVIGLCLGLGLTEPTGDGTRPEEHDEPRLTSAPGYVVLLAGVGLVYFWTMVAKLEPDWLSGAALERVIGRRLPELQGWLGLTPEELSDRIAMVAPTVAVLQAVIAVSFIGAPWFDRGRKLLWAGSFFAFGAALSFHVGAELLPIDIGWFSFYMWLAAAVVFLPREVVDLAGRGATLPLRALATWLEARRPAVDPAPVLLGAVVAGLLTYWSAVQVDLPGFEAAAIVAGLAIVAGAVAWVLRSRHDSARRSDSALASLALAVGALAMWGTIQTTETRFDFYRYLGGAHYRMEAWEQALVAYGKANEYAPPDRDRRRQEAEARREARRRR